ncbi:MAG TPA: DUF4112 domain-containing protein [Pirellulales bacterium]|jgi:hypothetical protein
MSTDYRPKQLVGSVDRAQPREPAWSGRDQPPEKDDSLAHLAWIAHWLDEGFRIPNVGIRFGWDSIAKLIPVFGDALGLIASLYLFSSLRRLDLPRVTRARMAMNIGIDYVVGLIPFLGAIFDVYWKPNVWNVGLAQRHLSAIEPAHAKKARRSDALFIIATTLVALLVIAGTIASCVWLVGQIIHVFSSAKF